MQYLPTTLPKAVPWNKGRLIGQRPPLKQKEIWAIRIHLQLTGHIRDLALFNLAIDSKLRGCDLVQLRVRDITTGNGIATRAMIMQQKTNRPVQFEISDQCRQSIAIWIDAENLSFESYLFGSRVHEDEHISTRQYIRLSLIHI